VATLFISDLHIDASRPAITEQFLSFLRTEATSAEALYILGDLFESWVGDDAADAAQSAAGAALLTPLSKSALLAKLADAQAYAANQPHWSRFERKIAGIDAFVLRRGTHPRDSVEALTAILDSPRSPA